MEILVPVNVNSLADKVAIKQEKLKQETLDLLKLNTPLGYCILGGNEHIVICRSGGQHLTHPNISSNILAAQWLIHSKEIRIDPKNCNGLDVYRISGLLQIMLSGVLSSIGDFCIDSQLLIK